MSTPPEAGPPPPFPAVAAWSRGKTWLAAGCLVVAALAAYFNSFRVPLLLDDDRAITQNATIRHLWPLSGPLSPPPNTGPSGRPLFNLSLALNYAISGTDVWSYHALNLLIHILNGLILFGIVRRTLARHETQGKASFLAFAVALLWLVHPLQTESITYLSERAEALMGLFYLLTLYCFICGTTRLTPLWFSLSILACFCGVATKEVMVTAPLVVFLYDAIFVAGSPRKAWQARRLLYCGLAASWIFLAWLMLARSKHSVGFHQGVSTWEYALTECQAVVHYFELAIWPNPLVFDYGPVLVSGPGKILPEIVVLLLLQLGTAWLCRRSLALGFLGLWCFILLAPTSSVVPVVLQPIAENRMYLPLAAVMVGVVLAADRWLGRQARWLVLVLALGSIAWTARRNGDYRDALTLWTDTVRKRPHNPRAQDSLGFYLAERGRPDEAIAHLRLARELTPEVGRIHYHLAKVLHDSGRRDEAIAEYREAVRLEPADADAQASLAAALAETGHRDEAQSRLQTALRLNSGDAGSHYGLGLVLFRGGEYAAAAREFQQALQLDPNAVEPRDALGNALFAVGRLDEAKGEFERALRLDPNDAEAHFRLGNILASGGQLPAAMAQWEASLQLRPGDAEAHNNLAMALAQTGKIPEAIQHLQEAIRLKPDYDRARANLADLQAQPDAAAK